MAKTPVRVARDASRSRAYWELREALGDEEAAARWPQALSDLKAMRPELSNLTSVERQRVRQGGSYREPARSHTSMRLRGSERGRRRSLALIGLAGLYLVMSPWLLGGMGIFYGVLAASSLLTGVVTLKMGWRSGAIRIDAAKVAVVRRGKTELELDRDEIAYVEIRSVHDEQLVHQLGLVQRLAHRDRQLSASWVCVVTTDGELVTLGDPVDEAAAIALCAAIEDELELLPVALEGVRARVAPHRESVEVLAQEPEASAQREAEG